MEIKPNQSLAELTTFHIGGPASFFVEVGNEEELKEALDFYKQKNLEDLLILGGGSNLLVADAGLDGLAIKVAIKGIEIVKEDSENVWVRVGAGEVWDDVVAWSVAKNLWGIENLSAVPGFTGGVPVQNVGAYGQDASQVVTQIEAFSLRTLEKKVLPVIDLDFAYRTSNFNTIWKDKYAITYIIFKLSKSANPNLEYVDVKKYFENQLNPTQQEIRNAIIEIRKNKFPDVNQLGNAGSCFKNVVLTHAEYDLLKPEVRELLEQIKNKFPQANDIKIPAAFLIDLCGLKGLSVGKARLWEKQPLVIVNEGNAKASDIMQLIDKVRQAVYDKTGLELRTEPERIGF